MATAPRSLVLTCCLAVAACSGPPTATAPPAVRASTVAQPTAACTALLRFTAPKCASPKRR